MKMNLPVIVLNSTVLMPEEELKIEFSDESSKNTIDEAEMFHENNLLIVTKLSMEENILLKDLPPIGTYAKITKKLELPNGKIRILLKGISRLKVIEYLSISKGSIESLVSILPSEILNEETKKGIIRKLFTELDLYIEKVPYMSNSLISQITNSDDIGKITDIIVINLPIDYKKRFEYLIELNSLKRVEMILSDMYKEEQLFNIEKSIDTKVKKVLDKEQKNFYLTEKIKLLKTELGQLSPKEEEINILKEKVKSTSAKEEIKNKILYEISRYESMSSASPELSFVRNYIEFMLELPWGKYTTDIDNLNEIKKSLDNRHYALDEVKSRIIEYLAVKKQSKNINAPIICLVGPPGVGKTTLAYSIAKSMGRNFTKISVGGIDDEAIIKGHIRTYVGSTPGRIIDGIKRAKSSNPVFLIDEIDKMSSNYKGDPKSALLEVLDSNQNKYFKDNFIEEEYDLSDVLFITTANDINNIPEALQDRLEIININGYTELEKIEIVKKHLIPTICEEHNIKTIKITDENILEIIRYYTKESGLRELERMISKIVRKIVTSSFLNNKKINYNIKNIENYLGRRIYDNNYVANDIGIVNALAYTNYGGEIIQVETNFYEGNGNIILTGSMGDIMLESAKIALSYIKANYKLFNIEKKKLNNNIHINVPNISIKKEGPSAGIAIITSIISALTDLKISNKVAFTGELTLRGNVLKIGGLKEKVIGAYINNVDTIFIPYANLFDLEKVPEEIKSKIKFIPVKKYEEIYKYLSEK